MTQKEVSSVMLYYKERGFTYKARLAELGIPEWRFYSSKSVMRKHNRETLEENSSNLRAEAP